MTYIPGGGGGGGSVGTSSDVALNNAATGEVLTYDAGLAKWRNSPVNSYDVAYIDALVQKVDAVVKYDAVSSTYPLRSTATSDIKRRVRWVGPVAPGIGGNFAVDNLDIWEKTG